MADTRSRRGKRLAFGITLAFLAFYVGTVGYAAAKVGDFYHLWLAGHLVASGRVADLYDPAVHHALLEAVGAGGLWTARNDAVGAFFYPPHTALFYASFCWLSRWGAAVVQALLNIGAGVGVAVLAARMSGGRVHACVALPVLFASSTFFYCYGLGQNGILSCAVLLAAAVLLKERRDLAAGLVYALLVGKPSWLLATVWIPVALGRWRALAATAAGAAAIVVGTLLVLGPGAYAEYASLVPEIAALDKLPEYPLTTQHNGLAVTRRALGIGILADLLGWASSLLLVGATLWRWRARPTSWMRGAGLGLAAATWANPHLQHYDMIPAVVSGVVVLAAWGDLKRWGRIGALGVLAALYASFTLDRWVGDAVSVPALWVLLAWLWLALAPEEVARRSPGRAALRRAAGRAAEAAWGSRESRPSRAAAPPPRR